MNQNIYGERANNGSLVTLDSIELQQKYKLLMDQLQTGVDFNSNAIYITDSTLEDIFGIIIKVRSILNQPKVDAITFIINVKSASIYDVLSIIDYIDTLDIKVNMLVRGQAIGAAAVLVAAGTGTRAISKHAQMDFDSVTLKSNSIQSIVIDMLVKRTDADETITFWRELLNGQLKTDNQLLIENNIIDIII